MVQQQRPSRTTCGRSHRLQYLENDNSDNEFLYDSFEGRVVVGDASVGNTFRLCDFDNPTGTCLRVNALHGTYVYKGYFRRAPWTSWRPRA